MPQTSILEHLAEEEAILTNSHFIYTSGMHGTAYINMRAVAHDAGWFENVVGPLLGRAIDEYQPDIIVGPETLGRTIAQVTAPWLGADAVWCDMEVAGEKLASFSPKLDFGRLIRGKKVAIVDDLLTTGSSIKLVSDLIVATGGEVVAAAVVARRSPNVTEAECNVPVLKVLVDVEGFEVFTPEECLDHGPCSKEVPVVLRPGHGHAWIKDHPDYPVAS
jgi:orotate phosphoribosyltransferase